MARFAVGFMLAGLISLAARRLRFLTAGGAAAATCVGGAVCAGIGMQGSAALIAYFLSSALLGRLPAATARPQLRGNERDAVQVLANGGVPAALAVASLTGQGAQRACVRAAFAGAVAAAAADTWATELGTRFGQHPRSVVTFKPLPAGTSGGVTIAGLAGAVAAASLIAAITAPRDALAMGKCTFRSGVGAIVLGGVAGSLADSVLGATIQDVRFCDACGTETELPLHGCGTRTRRLRGKAWCTNDTVNALAIALGAAATVAASARPPRSQRQGRGARWAMGNSATAPYPVRLGRVGRVGRLPAQ